MWEGAGKPEPLPEAAVHRYLLAAEEACAAGHILHRGLLCHGAGLDAGMVHPSPNPLPSTPTSQAWSRAGCRHHAELPAVGQARVFPSSHPSACQTLCPSPRHSLSPKHRSPAPSTALLRQQTGGGGGGGELVEKRKKQIARLLDPH